MLTPKKPSKVAKVKPLKEGKSEPISRDAYVKEPPLRKEIKDSVNKYRKEYTSLYNLSKKAGIDKTTKRNIENKMTKAGQNLDRQFNKGKAGYDKSGFPITKKKG